MYTEEYFLLVFLPSDYDFLDIHEHFQICIQRKIHWLLFQHKSPCIEQQVFKMDGAFLTYRYFKVKLTDQKVNDKAGAFPTCSSYSILNLQVRKLMIELVHFQHVVVTPY